MKYLLRSLLDAIETKNACAIIRFIVYLYMNPQAKQRKAAERYVAFMHFCDWWDERE